MIHWDVTLLVRRSALWKSNVAVFRLLAFGNDPFIGLRKGYKPYGTCRRFKCDGPPSLLATESIRKSL
jgi:hypothetical protein